MTGRNSFSLLLLFLSGLSHAVSEPAAVNLVGSVTERAQNAHMWEAEGQMTENAGDGNLFAMPAQFRISIVYPSDRSAPAKARLEVMGGATPLVKICDGSSQWTYLLSARQFWTISDSQIDRCAYPFTEWLTLADHLKSPAFLGDEELKITQRRVKCAVVRGDFPEQGTDQHASSRTLWIEESTKMVWQYRAERLDQNGKRSVQTYTFGWQTRDGSPRSNDLFEIRPVEGTELPSAPAHLEPITRPFDLPKNLYRIGGFVTPPALIHKVEPEYTKGAQKAKIEGTVILIADIQPDGTAHNFEVKQSLDPGLDRKAIEAVTKWRFRPGVRDGVPVSVMATFEIHFKLR